MTNHNRIPTKAPRKEQVLTVISWALDIAIVLALLAGFVLWVVAA